VPAIVALLLGAVLASTDPATLVPVFKQIRIRERVAQTVMSESAFNDAMGAIVTFAVLGVAMGAGEFSATDALLDLFKQSLFGIAVETGIVMVIYLNDAMQQLVAAKGNSKENISKEDLRTYVMHGAVKRLRPKLMTVSVALFGLVPVLWSTGTGSGCDAPYCIADDRRGFNFFDAYFTGYSTDLPDG